MDAALKQRLIGATVLVALAVIFLPMLVQGPDPEQSSTAAVPLDAPAQPTTDADGRALETREILLPQPNSATPTPTSETPAASDDPNAVATVDTTVAARVDAVSGETLNGADALPTTATPVTNAPATTGSDTAETDTAMQSAPAAMPTTPVPASTTAKPTSTTAKPTASTSTVPAATVSKPAVTEEPLPTSTASGNFAVNVGSYANVANAEALLAKLKAAGLTAYAESTSLDGKAVRRIRLGPYAQRGEADRRTTRASRPADQRGGTRCDRATC